MNFFVNSSELLRGMIPLLRTDEQCYEWFKSCDEYLRLIHEHFKNRRVSESEQQRLTLLMSSVEIVRTCVRNKIACIVAELDAREALLASSSSDDDNDVRVNYLSTLLQLDDGSLTIERHKIRDALSVPTLSETSWISIFQRGFMQLPREHRQLLRHIARYSTASKCTLYCIVGDKDVHLKYMNTNLNAEFMLGENVDMKSFGTRNRVLFETSGVREWYSKHVVAPTLVAIEEFQDRAVDGP